MLEEALELAGPELLLVVVGARLRIAELWRAVASPAAAQPADAVESGRAALDAGHPAGAPQPAAPLAAQPRHSDAA